jgi:hypothetical protein
MTTYSDGGKHKEKHTPVAPAQNQTKVDKPE